MTAAELDQINEEIRANRVRRQLRAVEILRSTVCACDHHKSPKKAVCWACWKKLSYWRRRSLFAEVGNGFLDNYDRALEDLRAAGRITDS